MPLPFLFANQTQPNLAWLDADFAAVGQLTTIPCIISGTNTLTLVQEVNTPTISAYSNYLRLSGVIAVTNTGPVTVQLAALGAFPVYKDTTAGPVALVGSELQANNAVVFIYDQALNTGAGGFHVSTPTSGAGTGTVTSVATNNGLTGGPITTTGTLGLAAVNNLRLLANVSGGSAVPTPNTLTNILDQIIGTTQGTIIARGAATWAAVTPGIVASSPVMSSTGVGWGLIVSATTAAAGNSQGTAAAIGLCNIAVIATVGGSTGIILPATGTSPISVVCRGGNNLSVYPNSGAQIEGLGTNNADTVVATTGNAIYVPTAFSVGVPTQWYRTVAS